MAEGMKIMIQYTCCFSGHRSIEEIHLKSLKDNLQNEIISLIQQKMQYFICGGALGFDTLAAQTVIALKKLYSHIHLTLMLPCRDQDKYWKTPQKKQKEHWKWQKFLRWNRASVQHQSY